MYKQKLVGRYWRHSEGTFVFWAF